MMATQQGGNWHSDCTHYSMIDRCILVLTGFLMLIAMGAFLLVVPVMVAMGIAVVTVGTVLIFLLGVQVGARAVRQRDDVHEFLTD